MLKAVVFVLPLLLVACGDPAGNAPAARAMPGLAEAGKAPPPSAVSPPEDTMVEGLVIESMNAGAYTYVRLKGSSGEIWAAVNETTLKPGSKIAIGNAMWMEKFESKRLNRTFDRILFGSLVTAEERTALPPGHPPPASGAPAQADPVADPGGLKVEKAAGKDAKTVAEVWAQKASLKGVEVVIRGRVVKFNAEIMGRNWIHLRDGSGSEERKDNDITVTTAEVATKGEVLTLRGKVAIDQDFTAGYAYPVMIESARLVR